MKTGPGWGLPPLLVIIALATAGCGGAVSDEHVVENQPYTLEDVPGSDLKLVTLTERAVERLGIETDEVFFAGGQLAVSSRALWVDTDGAAWVYTNPEQSTYLRHQVTVETDDGTTALLAMGPPEGTVVVTAGVPELYGTEIGVGK